MSSFTSSSNTDTSLLLKKSRLQVYLRTCSMPNLIITILSEGDEGVPETPPTLENFKTQINSYEEVYCEVDKIAGTEIIDVWFRVDARPFKQALLTTIKRWSHMFKQHLADHVTNR